MFDREAQSFICDDCGDELEFVRQNNSNGRNIYALCLENNGWTTERIGYGKVSHRCDTCSLAVDLVMGLAAL